MYSNIAKWKFWHVAKTKFDHFCQIYKHFIAKNKNENLHRNWWAESRDGYIDFHGRNLNRNWTMSISDYWNWTNHSFEQQTSTSSVLVVVDYFTRWPEAYAIPDQTAQTVSQKLVEECVSRFGVMQQLRTDQGKTFQSNLFQEMTKILGI